MNREKIEVTGAELKMIAWGYRTIHDALVFVLTENVGISQQEAVSAVDAFAEYISRLGAVRAGLEVEDDHHAAIIAEWETDGFQAVMMKVLGPFGMDDAAKTKHLMRLARDMELLSEEPGEAEIREVMGRYLNSETIETALSMMRKDKEKKCSPGDYASFGIFTGIDLNFSPREECVTMNEAITLIENHYEKKLPKLRRFAAGLELWLENNEVKLAGIAVAGAALYKTILAVKAGDIERAAVDATLDKEGMKKEIFWYLLYEKPPSLENSQAE